VGLVKAKDEEEEEEEETQIPVINGGGDYGREKMLKKLIVMERKEITTREADEAEAGVKIIEAEAEADEAGVKIIFKVLIGTQEKT